jgi:hypothetical protein
MNVRINTSQDPITPSEKLNIIVKELIIIPYINHVVVPIAKML